jgi:hypothetical protein
MNRLVRFIGYGPRKPQAVFLGIEEAGGGADNIKTRTTVFDEIEDLMKPTKNSDVAMAIARSILPAIRCSSGKLLRFSLWL